MNKLFLSASLIFIFNSYTHGMESTVRKSSSSSVSHTTLHENLARTIHLLNITPFITSLRYPVRSTTPLEADINFQEYCDMNKYILDKNKEYFLELTPDRKTLTLNQKKPEIHTHQFESSKLKFIDVKSLEQIELIDPIDKDSLQWHDDQITFKINAQEYSFPQKSFFMHFNALFKKEGFTDTEQRIPSQYSDILHLAKKGKEQLIKESEAQKK